MWTFKKTEKREYYESDIEAFKKMVVKRQSECVDYQYISLYSLPYSKIKRLYNIIVDNALGKRTSYMVADNNMLYFPINNRTVIGLSFQSLRYIGVERDKVISLIKRNKSNRIYFTSSDNMRKMSNWFHGREFAIASIFEKFGKKGT